MISVTYDDVVDPDVIGEPTLLGAPPEGPTLTNTPKLNLFKELAPHNLRGLVSDVSHIVEANKQQRDLHAQASQGKIGPAMGQPMMLEARVPQAVHMLMEEKYGYDWYKDDELFTRFLLENPSYYVYEWRRS